MTFIIENWPFIVFIIVIAFISILAGIRFFKSSKESQIKKLREWLLYATTIAEKELGSGTGKLKLRYVYDMFATKFPWLVKIISFDRFSELVDDVLRDMNSLLQTNSAVQLYVNGPDETDENAEG